jgi:TrpR family trp operon transcriptional repressor
MNEAGWHYFLELCLAANNEETLSELFSLLLTHEEKADMETRCLIIRDLLSQKKTQRQMADELHVSIAKITRGSNELKRISPELRHFIQTVLRKDQ